MKRTMLFLLIGLLVLGGIALSGFAHRRPAGRASVVARGPLTVWSPYDGTLEARHEEVIMSPLNGSATIIELAAEGMHVEPGDLLVRFDDSVVRRELVKLERDYALSKSELVSLEQAVLPLEIQDLKLQYLQARGDYDAEKQFMEDSLPMQAEGLLSAQEIEQEKVKVEGMSVRLTNVIVITQLTQQFLHPAKLERARATLAAAEQERDQARQQLERSVIRSPAAGVVVLRPLHVGQEYRTARVGDSVYQNQAFMAIPDMRDVVVSLQIPEAELSRVAADEEVRVTPLAYPGLVLRGVVETVGSMAQIMPGSPGWQRYFRVGIALSEVDERLRSGMSVYAQILSYHKEDVVRVPREAIWWQAGVPYCQVRTWHSAKSRALVVGRANYSHYEVLKGLAAGDVVLLP